MHNHILLIKQDCIVGILELFKYKVCLHQLKLYEQVESLDHQFVSVSLRGNSKWDRIKENTS